MVDLARRVLYGIPQENEVGSMIILISSIGNNAESQEFVCSTLAWKVTVELDTSSLASALSQYIDKRTNESSIDIKYLRCLSHPSIILASLNVGIGLPYSLAKLADVVAGSLNVSTEVIQVVDSSSSISFYKQLKKLRILQYENVVETKFIDRTYHVSWPLGCNHNDVGSLDIPKLYRRSLSGVPDMMLHGWHLASGFIDGEVHARKRRAVYFGSITALDGTPLQTSILSTNIISSAIFTSISSSVNRTVLFATASAFPTSSLSTVNSSVLPSLPTTMRSSFIPSAVSQASGDITNSFSNTMVILTSNVSRQTISSNFTLLIEPSSSQIFLLKSTSPPSVLDKSSSGSLFSLYPSTLKGFSNTSLPYMLTSTSSPSFSRLSVQSTAIASTAPINIDNTTLSIRASLSQVSAYSLTETPSKISTQYTLGASFSRPAPSFTVVDSLYSSHFSVASSLSLPYHRSSTETLNLSSIIQSSIPPSFSFPRNSVSDVISQSVAIQSTSLFPFLSTISDHSLSSAVSVESSHYILASSFSIPYQQNSTGIPVFASIVPSSAMGTFASSQKATGNESSEARPMQSTLILPSKTFIDVAFTSRYSATRSFSIPYQQNSTGIPVVASIAPSSSMGTFASSHKATGNESSEARSMQSTLILPSKTFIDVAFTSRYSATPSFSIPYQLNSTEVVSMLQSLISASFASSRRDTSNMSTQTILAQSTSHLPFISIINTSAHLRRSDISSQAATGMSREVSLTAVASTSIPKLASVISSHSFASSYSSIRLQGDNSSSSSIGEPVLSSRLPLDLSTTRQSNIVPSQTEFKTIASTDILLSKVPLITATVPSGSILLSETATASKVLKSVSELLSKNRTISATGAVSSTFGYTASLATTFSQFQIVTTTVKSSVTGFSSGFTFVSASSYLKTNQSLTLTSHFTNLTLVSYSMMSFSGASTVAATPILNTNPMLVNSIGRISAHVGRLLVFKIPFDTFYDRESGYTPSLSVSCRFASGQNLEKSFWILYDNTSQTLSGLPLVDEYNRQGSEGAGLEVIARDPSGGIARDVFNVYIENTPVDIQFTLTARISRQYQEFQTDSSLKSTLLNRIIRFYNVTAMSNYYISSITNGSVLFSWSDTTVSESTCNSSAITTIANNFFVQSSSGSVTEGFQQAMLPDFPVLGVTLKYFGVCSVMPTTPAAPVGPAAGERSVDIFIRYAVPTIAIAMVLAFIVGAVIFLSKRRRNKPPFFEKRTFRKGRPVLLPEEYELDGIRDPVISLPEDYVFSNTDDGNSVYSHPASDSWDEDGKSYMDNPVYGLSKFDKPPPLYKREMDSEGDYDSPYERPPPLYQMPPFYQDEDFMTSEV